MTTEQDQDDLRVLAAVGRMYLDALDSDPNNEMLTLPEALRVTEVRDAVERQEQVGTEPHIPPPARVRRLPDGSTEIYQSTGQVLATPNAAWTKVESHGY